MASSSHNELNQRSSDSNLLLHPISSNPSHHIPLSWHDILCINSLTPGRLEWNLIQAIFNLILVNGGRGIKCETALRCMSLDLTEDKSTVVQVMAWCRQATSHYLSQCWPRSLPPYGVTRPQWCNTLATTSVIKGCVCTRLHECLQTTGIIVWKMWLLSDICLDDGDNRLGFRRITTWPNVYIYTTCVSLIPVWESLQSIILASHPYICVLYGKWSLLHILKLN